MNNKAKNWLKAAAVLSGILSLLTSVAGLPELETKNPSEKP